MFLITAASSTTRMASAADTRAASKRVAYALIALRNSDNLTPRIIRTGCDSYGVDARVSGGCGARRGQCDSRLEGLREAALVLPVAGRATANRLWPRSAR